MVEFALSIPLLLIILFGVIYYGQVFLISQILLYAAQEGAKVASRTPNLSNSSVRDTVRGFTTSGSPINTASVIYSALSSSMLLSQGNTGTMPAGSRVEILPWDSDGTPADQTPAGTVGVRISYPFQFPGNNLTVAIATSTSGGTPMSFLGFTITERAIASQEIYQD